MGIPIRFYDMLKDVLDLAQKIDNRELYKQLLDLGSKALELQNENARLMAENIELKRARNLEDDLVYYPIPYLTKKSDTKDIKYCAACWGTNKILIPLQKMREKKFMCSVCKAYIYEEGIKNTISY